MLLLEGQDSYETQPYRQTVKDWPIPGTQELLVGCKIPPAPNGRGVQNCMRGKRGSTAIELNIRHDETATAVQR